MLLELLEPGAVSLGTLVLGLLVRGVKALVKQGIAQLTEILESHKQLHAKLDEHIVQDATRYDATQESMKQMWGMLGDKGRR